MLKSQIIEANSFTQTRCEFSIPAKLAASMKLAHLGVYGAQSYLTNGQLGQVAVIKKITLRQGGTVLSQYDRYFRNYLEFKTLGSGNSYHRNIAKQLKASNYGMVLNDGGSDVAAIAGVANAPGSGALRPRVCVDKKDLKTTQALEADTHFAMLDLAECLGFCNAVYQDGSNQISGVIPCHIFSNLKLQLEFEAPATVAANATTVAQPYLIFNEVEDDALAQRFMSRSLAAQFSDYELESVFLGTATSSKKFLNSFYGKTLGNLVYMVDSGQAVPRSYAQGGEVFRLLVNNSNLIQLTTGIDHPGKKAAFTRMTGSDLTIVSLADRTIPSFPAYNADHNASATSLYEGDANSASTESEFYTAGTQSYLVLPIQTKIDKLQLDYSRTDVGNINLLFWAEVGKVMTFDSMGAVVISYM
jgi:hypothetical protein